MKAIFASLLLGSLLLSYQANADFDKEEVTKIAAKVKAGEGFHINGSMADSAQSIRFQAGQLAYTIDFRTKLCLVGTLGVSDGGLIAISCKSVKEGFPVLAPLITWEK